MTVNRCLWEPGLVRGFFFAAFVFFRFRSPLGGGSSFRRSVTASSNFRCLRVRLVFWLISFERDLLLWVLGW